MSLPSSLTVLSARIDKTLNEFALVANAEGEYPWQTAQREKRNRRVAGAAVGATVIGAGAYGAKKGMDALNKRYGTTGTDGLKTGAADLINRGDDAMKAGWQKAKGYAGQGMDAAKAGMNRVGSYGKKILRAGQQGYKQGGLKGAGSLALRALRKVRFEGVEPLNEFTGSFTVRDPQRSLAMRGMQPYKPGVTAALKKRKLMSGMKALGRMKFESVAPVLVALEKRIDARLQAFSDKDYHLLYDLPDDFEGRKIKIDKDGKVVSDQATTPRRYSKQEAIARGGKVNINNGEMTIEGHDSPARVRRAKAVMGMAATGAAGYHIGKNRRRIAAAVGGGLKKVRSAIKA